MIINIKGNTESLKASLLQELEALYHIEFTKDELVPVQLAESLASLTSRINREIAVFIDRKGNVVEVSVGDNSTVDLPAVEGRRDRSRLSGIRCIHTHPNSDGMLSSVDIRSMLSLRLDAMVALGVRDGSVVNLYAGIPSRDSEGSLSKAEVYGPFEAGDRRLNSLFDIIAERDKLSGSAVFVNESEAERAILVGLETGAGKIVNGKSEGERLLDELEELSSTAGIIVLNKVLQRKELKDTAFYVGRGKIDELNLMRQSLNANLIIFDDELSGAQVRNIEEAVGVKVVDRTTLILDIFAQRARSREGKIQVELAQLKYRLPRLIGLGSQLSRLGGGIGTRGPGEKKLEVDRRHIRRRINYLEGQLKEVSKRRGMIRESRKKNAVPAIALVGYTNAGKSTLMNTLCNTEVFAENKLFATLDPTTRSLALPDGREALLVDTVGFIRKLPHDLIEAFKSTLEEAVYADVLLHVVDASNDEAGIQIAVVEEILFSLGALNKPVILVLNKMDQISAENRVAVTNPWGKIFEVSAVTGRGLDKLLDGIVEVLPADEVEVELLAPYSMGWILPYIHQNGRVLGEEYTESGTLVKAVIKKAKMEKIKGYAVTKL